MESFPVATPELAVERTARPRKRLIGIDALRGLAAVAVCLFHWEHIAFGTANADQVFRWGLLGVELFFTISGFVILMAAESAPSVTEFIIARILRLYPAYLLSVLLTAVYVLWVGKYKISAVLVNLTMLQSFFGSPNISNPYWTLAFEVSFYSIIVIVLARRALSHLELIASFWILAGLLYRFLVPENMLYNSMQIWTQVLYIVLMPQFSQFFVMGLLIYRLYNGELKSIGWATLVLCIAVAFLGRGDFAQIDGMSYAAAEIIIGLFVWYAIAIMPSFPLVRPIAWIGHISYPLYLFHCTVANLCVVVGQEFNFGAPAAVALSIPLSIALAFTIHTLVEKPCTLWWRRLKRNWTTSLYQNASKLAPLR